MVDTTQATQARMRRFVADASHELRTPLTTLQGYSSLHTPGGGASAEVVDDAMRRINAEATRMTRIVEGLLQLTDLDEHGVTMREPVDLVPSLPDVVVRPRVVQPGAPGLARRARRLVVVRGDRDRLIQVVVALTSNAMRHTPDDRAARGAGPRGRAGRHGSRWPTAVPASRPSTCRTCSTGSTGPTRGRARSQGGNGLGLAVVASIVSAHGGRYGVSSSRGQGSTFWFELPLA